MREILFRGKRFDNGKWVEGGYIPLDVDSGYTYIIEPCNYASTFSALDLIKLHSILVIPSTVGQYTGLTDKNGTRIFEGDIVHAIYQSNYVGMKNIDFGIGVVEYCGNYYSHASYEINIIGEIGSRVFSAGLEGGVEVIGNIHDNPELLEIAAKPIDKNIAQSGLAPATENFELMEG